MIAPLNCSSSPKVPVWRALRPSPSPYVWNFSLGFQYPNTINPARAWSTIYFHFPDSYHSPRLRPYADSITCGFEVNGRRPGISPSVMPFRRHLRLLTWNLKAVSAPDALKFLDPRPRDHAHELSAGRACDEPGTATPTPVWLQSGRRIVKNTSQCRGGKTNRPRCSVGIATAKINCGRGVAHEQCASTGWHPKRRIHPDLGWKPGKMGCQRSPFRGMGTLPSQGLARRSQSNLCVAVQRLGWAGPSPLQSRRQDPG